MASSSKRFDRRIVNRKIRSGNLKQTDYDKHLSTLPDDADNADWVEIDMEEAEVTGISDADSSDLGSASLAGSDPVDEQT